MDSLAIACGYMWDQIHICLENLPAFSPVAREVANHDVALLARKRTDDLYPSFRGYQESYETTAASP